MPKTDKPSAGSGKTQFNRLKVRGQSWVELRDEARRNGDWSPTQQHKEERHETGSREDQNLHHPGIPTR